MFSFQAMLRRKEGGDESSLLKELDGCLHLVVDAGLVSEEANFFPLESGEVALLEKYVDADRDRIAEESQRKKQKKGVRFEAALILPSASPGS